MLWGPQLQHRERTCIPKGRGPPGKRLQAQEDLGAQQAASRKWVKVPVHGLMPAAALCPSARCPSRRKRSSRSLEGKMWFPPEVEGALGPGPYRPGSRWTSLWNSPECPSTGIGSIINKSHSGMPSAAAAGTLAHLNLTVEYYRKSYKSIRVPSHGTSTVPLREQCKGKNKLCGVHLGKLKGRQLPPGRKGPASSQLRAQCPQRWAWSTP